MRDIPYKYGDPSAAVYLFTIRICSALHGYDGEEEYVYYGPDIEKAIEFVTSIILRPYWIGVETKYSAQNGFYWTEEGDWCSTLSQVKRYDSLQDFISEHGPKLKHLFMNEERDEFVDGFIILQVNHVKEVEENPGIF